MSQLNVYIITDGKSGKDVNRLAHLFSDEMYDVMEAVVPPLEKFNNEIDEYADKEELYDLYQVQWCLEQSRMIHSNRPVLIIRDSSVSFMNSEKLKMLLIEIMKNDSDYDMFYLSRWNDDCQKHVDNKQYANIINVARTYAANGTQAIYFSVKGRDIMTGRKVMRNDRYLRFTKSVNKKIVKQLHAGNIIAYCTLHNVFEFDITRATRNSDFNKLSACSIMFKHDSNKNNTNNLGYLWFVIIVILIIILAFAIARIGK